MASGQGVINLNNIIDKEFEKKPLKEIIKLPPSALQGLTPEKDAVLAKFKIDTIEELGKWKFHKLACAVVELASFEEAIDSSSSKSGSEHQMNIDGAFDKEFRHMPMRELCNQPLHSILGMAEWVDVELPKLKKMSTVKDLAEWRFPRIAANLVELAKYEK